MTTPVKPEKLTKGNEDRLHAMLKDICGPMLAELVKEQQAAFREELEKQQKEAPIPAWLQQIAANAAEKQPTEDETKAALKYVKDLPYQMIDKGARGGDALARMVTAVAASKHDAQLGRQGWYKLRYGGEDDVWKALAATDAVSGGFLVPDAQVMEVIELLYPASVVRQMMPNVETMVEGKLSLPGLATGATAAYLGENSNVTATGQTFRQVDLMAKKLAALVPISNDLIRRRSGTSNIVRDDLVNAIATKSDSAFIRSDGTASEPKGLRYRANSANLLTVNATINTENVMADLGNAMLALMNNDVRMIRPGWLMAPRTWMALMLMSTSQGDFFMRQEVSNKRLFGYPIGVTTNIPINLAVTGTNESEIYFVDWADVVIGESTTLMLDASTEAAYHDGLNVVAAFSLDQTVLRAIIEHDIVLRHDYSVAVLTDVDWTTGITT